MSEPPPYRFDPSLAENIPTALRTRTQWVLWRYELRGERWTKVPYRAAEPWREASSTDSATWAAFPIALSNVSRAHGIGFVFSGADSFIGVDFDHCLTDSMSLELWAFDWVVRLRPCYVEVSPSGWGLKAFVSGKPLPPKGKSAGRKRGGLGPEGHGAIELYDRGRYFTVTGDVWHP